MSIRIQRNENANAITFVGSSQPAYWNACLEGEVNEDDSSRINVVNTVRTTDSDNKVFEFFAVPFTEFRTALGTAFNTAQECADYITDQANATAIGIIEFGATDVVDFQRDATNTTILASTGHSYPVNSIKAVAQADGTITIKDNVDGGADLMRFVRRTNVTFGGQTQAQQLAPVVNALNSLFTVTPVGGGAEDRFVSNTYTSVTPAVTAFGDVTINADVATKGTNTSSEFNDGFFTSSAPITANGEYFQFDNSGNDPLKKMMIGLMLTSEISVAALEDNTLTGEDMDLAVRLKPNATYEHSPYGAVIENGMFTNPQRSNEYRAGIDNDGRLFISHYNEDASEWQVIVRSALVTANEEYSLVVFLKQENAVCSTLVTSKEIYDGPIMAYHYIESPDGAFYYPLFSTEAEANYLDTENGGSGTNHPHVFADETPTSQTWYMPATGGTHAATSAPSNTAEITYNVITTGADANYAPTAYGTQTLTVNEGDAVNFSIDPAGADWTTTISGQPPVNFTLSGGNLVGTAPEVTGIIADNASDEYVITVTRTNIFGTSTGTLTLTVNNLTQTITPISGFTHVSQTITMVDSDTLEAGSVVTIDDSLEQGKRMVFSAAFIQGLFDDIANSGSAHSVLIGVLKTGLYGSQWTNHSSANLQFGWRLHRESNNKYLSVIWNGDGISSTNFGTGTFGRDLVMFHDTASNKLHMTHHGVTGGTGETMDTPTVISNLHMTPGSSDVDITIGLSIGSSTNVDITTTGITEVNNPVVNTMVTNWTKALDFSGSNEYLVQTSTSANYNQPLKMSGSSVTASLNADNSKTSSDTNSRPWATTMVFKADLNNSNQHIWNSGEGAGTGDDNIYLRLTAAGSLMFGWGREGTGYNECRIANQSISSSNWYGVYIAHKGARFNSADATASNLALGFDIRLMSSADSFASLGSNLSTASNWTDTGARMDRDVTGSLTIGGRAGNRNFHGKIASMVVTTLKLDDTLPVDAEAKAMITDPMGWMDDYKIGPSETFRRSHDNWNQTSFLVPSGESYAYTSTQVWLMGDGVYDSYANGIRSEVLNTDQNYVKLHLQSMLSNDFETVTIPGLT